ncbi:MAG: hypothetical protein LH477_12380 [Nocardioides sp.]|nr:hypothetical protein [Nocardioides sp.]
MALSRATRLRAAHHELAAEYAALVPAGLALAVAARCARDLRREGDDMTEVESALADRARRVLVARFG